MCRSKAYLYRGVEIRWSCDPSLISDEDSTPAEETLHFPGGLADFLTAAPQRPQTVTSAPFAGAGRVPRRAGPGRMGDRLAGRTTRKACVSFYCNTVPTPEGGTHEQGLRAGLSRAAASAYGELVGNRKAGQITAEDVIGGAIDHAVAVHPRPAVPGPDQGKAGHAPRRRAWSRPSIKDHFDHWLSGDPARGQGPARLGDRAGRGAPAQAPGQGAVAQDRDAQAAPARQARRLQPSDAEAAPRSSWSRAIPPAAPPSRRATARPRPSCRCAARS